MMRSGMAMLHPETCASSIRWCVKAALHETHKSFDADVWLTDCHRQIQWSADGYGTEDGGRAAMYCKLTEAIDALTKARAALAVVGRYYDKLPGKAT